MEWVRTPRAVETEHAAIENKNAPLGDRAIETVLSRGE
jgi:hypothetical protein